MYTLHLVAFQHNRKFFLYYRVTCTTTLGNVTSPPSSGYRTGPGLPVEGPSVQAIAVNHTTVHISWSPPPVHLLKGSVESYRITYEVVDGVVYVYGELDGNITSVNVG